MRRSVHSKILFNYILPAGDRAFKGGSDQKYHGCFWSKLPLQFEEKVIIITLQRVALLRNSSCAFVLHIIFLERGDHSEARKSGLYLPDASFHAQGG